MVNQFECLISNHKFSTKNRKIRVFRFIYVVCMLLGKHPIRRWLSVLPKITRDNMYATMLKITQMSYNYTIYYVMCILQEENTTCFDQKRNQNSNIRGAKLVLCSQSRDRLFSFIQPTNKINTVCN